MKVVGRFKKLGVFFFTFDLPTIVLVHKVTQPVCIPMSQVEENVRLCVKGSRDVTSHGTGVDENGILG